MMWRSLHNIFTGTLVGALLSQFILSLAGVVATPKHIGMYLFLAIGATVTWFGYLYNEDKSP